MKNLRSILSALNEAIASENWEDARQAVAAYREWCEEKTGMRSNGSYLRTEDPVLNVCMTSLVKLVELVTTEHKIVMNVDCAAVLDVDFHTPLPTKLIVMDSCTDFVEGDLHCDEHGQEYLRLEYDNHTRTAV